MFSLQFTHVSAVTVTGYSHDDGTCHTISEVKIRPAPPPPAPSDFEAEFYFGSALPSSATAGAILDNGAGFTTGRSSLDYGWDCDGNTEVDFASGRRDLDRDGGLGLNHFDREGKCPGAVNWNLVVPNGVYHIEVNFGEDSAAAGWDNCANDHVGENALNFLEVEGEIA